MAFSGRNDLNRQVDCSIITVKQAPFGPDPHLILMNYTWAMLRLALYFLLVSWSVVAFCSDVREGAPDGTVPAPVTPSVLPVALTLNSARIQQAVRETLGAEVKRGVAEGTLYDGAVSYSLNWSVDMSRNSVSFSNSGGRVLMELGATLNLSPNFSLRKGAETIYAGSGCGRTNVSLLFSVALTAHDGALISTRQPVKVSFAQGYICVYDRNILGDVRNWFTRDTKKQIDVVPLMASGIKAKVDSLGAQLATSVSTLTAGDSLLRHLNQHLFQPWQISQNLWLWAKVQDLDIGALTVSKGNLSLSGKMVALPRFAFGSGLPKLVDGPTGPSSTSGDRFYIPFDLLIPRDPMAVNQPESIEMSKPGYRFRAVNSAPGIAALQRYQADLEEDVVLLQGGGTHSAGERIPMEGPINAVLKEIVDWLETNSGVRAATASSLDRLLREVRRVASLVAHFQRPRTIPLGAMGGLTLSDLSADLQWVSLEPNNIRAGVMLNGRATLNIEF